MEQSVSSLVAYSPSSFLAFYERHLEHYPKWARLHRYGYWVLIWLSIITGVALGFSMLLKVDTLFIAAFALGLNAVLVINALEGIRHRVAEYAAEGRAAKDAMLQAIKEFHGKIESLVLEEFGEFFREMTTLDELHKQLSARSDAGH
jgi:hypothetical protein